MLLKNPFLLSHLFCSLEFEFSWFHNIKPVISRLEDAFKTSSRHVFKTSSRRLQRNNFSSSKTSSRCLQDVFKTSSRRLRRRKIVTLKTCWRRLKDQQMFAGEFFIKKIVLLINPLLSAKAMKILQRNSVLLLNLPFLLKC